MGNAVVAAVGTAVAAAVVAAVGNAVVAAVGTAVAAAEVGEILRSLTLDEVAGAPPPEPKDQHILDAPAPQIPALQTHTFVYPIGRPYLRRLTQFFGHSDRCNTAKEAYS